MDFDWLPFLEQYGVEYVTAGANVGRGEVGIKCPFCGVSDPSQHMSISLEGRGWVCRRDRSHRGRSPVALIRALTGLPLEQARSLTGSTSLPGAGGVLSEVESLLAPSDAPVIEAPPLRELPEFKMFGKGLPSETPFALYMRRRGFDAAFMRRASRELGLRYCTRGPFAGRVVMLVHQNGALVGWTARAISPRATVRYRVLSADAELAERDGLPRARVSIENCLLWSDDLYSGGERLFVVEGPLDALKLRALGDYATCLFTNSPSSRQVNLLREIAPRFRRRIVLLDRGAEAQALQVTADLSALGFVQGWLPSGVKDPGELTADTLVKVSA